MPEESEDTYISKIAKSRREGLPFDIVRQLFLDDEQIANMLAIKIMTGHTDPSEFTDPIDKLALVYLSYYRPDLFGIEIEDEEEAIK